MAKSLKIGMKVYGCENNIEGTIVTIFDDKVVIKDKDSDDSYYVEPIDHLFISAAELKPIFKESQKGLIKGLPLLDIKIGDRVYDSELEYDGIVWGWNEKSCVYLIDGKGSYGTRGREGELFTSSWDSLEVRVADKQTFEVSGNRVEDIRGVP